MKYSPKLKIAMERIKAILKEYDIGGYVILHTPGFSEYHFKLNPSYSCIKVNGDEIRFRAKLKEDFAGDKIAWEKKVSDTVNLLTHLTDVTGPHVLYLMNLMDEVKKKIEIENKGGSHTSHTSQNN